MLARTLIAALFTAVVPSEEPICELVRPGSQVFPSRSCFSCHDGSIAPEANVYFVTPLAGFENPVPSHDLGAIDGPHPVDVDYAAAEARRPGWLRPINQLPPELLLPEGLVTCTTCHSSRSREEKKVSLPVAGSALCFSCHQL